MDAVALNMTSEITGFGRFLFLRIGGAQANPALCRSIEVLGANFENMHFVDGYPDEHASRRGRLQYLRAESGTVREGEIRDDKISGANALIRLEGRALEPLLAYEEGLRSLVRDNGGDMHVRAGVQKPRTYTSYAMAQFAYARALPPASGDRHPVGVVTPQSKTQDWWRMDWMRRESFFLPRYDEAGEMIAKGHALASAPGIPHINRRLFHHPQGYGLDIGYDFIGYFEFAEADAHVFRTVMDSLRDRAQNPEWNFVREGPEWWGRRVGRVAELWPVA